MIFIFIFSKLLMNALLHWIGCDNLYKNGYTNHTEICYLPWNLFC